MRRVELPGGLAVWLNHVLAEVDVQTEDGQRVLMLQFSVPQSSARSSVVTPGSPGGAGGETSPASALLTPEQATAYRAAVEPFTVRA